MNHLLLLHENNRNRYLLSEWLGQRYEIVQPDGDGGIQMPFDLCLIDGPALERLGPAIQARKAEEAPAFLPFVLITSFREADLITGRIWQTVDDVIRMPIEKRELQARVEILLRARHLSLDLRRRNEELESFFHAMSHDVRAPLRAVSGFIQLLQSEEADRLSPQGRHDLDQIQAAALQMRDAVNGLVDYARMDYGNRKMQRLSLDLVVQSCLRQLEHEITHRRAQVAIEGPLPQVQGNNILLASAVTNLLSNAVKFVKPGQTAHITIRAITHGKVCRLEIEDNGIGIAPEDAKRLFKPFAQLHGSEVYEGIGLGLATVRKATELMEGRSGVTPAQGGGSVFWLELRTAE